MAGADGGWLGLSDAVLARRGGGFFRLREGGDVAVGNNQRRRRNGGGRGEVGYAFAQHGGLFFEGVGHGVKVSFGKLGGGLDA